MNKRNYVFYLDLLSNTLDLSYVLPHWIKKTIKEECVINTASLYMIKPRHRGINEVTNKWKRCFMVSAFMDRVKFAETALSRDYWGKNSLSTPSIRRKEKYAWYLDLLNKIHLILPACLHFLKKKNYIEVVTNVPIF